MWALVTDMGWTLQGAVNRQPGRSKLLLAYQLPTSLPLLRPTEHREATRIARTAGPLPARRAAASYRYSHPGRSSRPLLDRVALP
jgi:hypothetical protein